MFCTYFQNTDDPFLTQPINEALPGFQKSLKQIFRDLFDLTGQSKFKACSEIIDNILYKTKKIVIFAFHASFLT
jgi:hypothetical protein